MEIVYRKLVDLKPHPDNPRKVKDENAIADFAEKIRTNPKHFEARPILLSNRTGELVIIGGERRWESAAYLGWETAPSILIEGLTEDEEIRILFEDNTHTGVWDDSKLAKWDKNKLKGWGVELPNWEKPKKETKQAVEDDFDPDKKVKSRCKFGELWQLGKHRLMCGDSTNKQDIEKLIGGGTIDLLLTDPPYGIKIVKKNKIGGGGTTKFKGNAKHNTFVASSNYMPIKGDESTGAAKKNYEIIKACTKNQILFGGNYFIDFLVPKACWIVWDKENTGNFADVELAWTSFNKGAKLYRFMWNGLARAGKRDVEGIKRVHPTQKPVGLMAMILQDFTELGNTVIDPFCGSGSTLIACEQLERICYAIEYEPHYCDVIIARWEKYTGQKAIKIEQ